MRIAGIESKAVRRTAKRLMLVALAVSVLTAPTAFGVRASSCDMPNLQPAALVQDFPCHCGHCEAIGPDADTNCDSAAMDEMDAEGETNAATSSPDVAASSLITPSFESSDQGIPSSGQTTSAGARLIAGQYDLFGAPGSPNSCQCGFRPGSEPRNSALTAPSDPVPAEASEADTVAKHLPRGFPDRHYTGPPTSSQVALYVIDSSLLI